MIQPIATAFFDNRLTYDKGAFLVRMLRWTLGDSAFLKGINMYLTDPKLMYGFAKTADLQRNLQRASGQNLRRFFNQWFYGEGYPSFTVQWKDSSDNKLYFTVSPDSIKAIICKLLSGCITGTCKQWKQNKNHCIKLRS